MARILEVWLRGWNEVVDAVDDVERHPGVSKFSDFLHPIGLRLEELSDVLRVPLKDLQELNRDGYISGDAKINIAGYLEAKNAVFEYRSRQSGPLDLK